MNVCDAPESKSITVGCLTTGNIPHHNRLSLRHSLHLSVEDSSGLLLQFAFLSILIIALILILILLLSCRGFLKVGIIVLQIRALPREVN
jgi:hypothetical protein